MLNKTDRNDPKIQSAKVPFRGFQRFLPRCRKFTRLAIAEQINQKSEH